MPASRRSFGAAFVARNRAQRPGWFSCLPLTLLLDELAFLYYLRSAPLEVGQSYSLDRYFKSGYNPVGVTVTGKESVPTPDGGTRPCLAVRVTSRGTSMQVWFSDDKRRLPVQLELPLPFGSVTLSLVGQGGSAAAGR